MYFNLSSSTILSAFSLLLLSNSGSFVSAQTIYQLAGEKGLTTLATAVEKAGLDGALNGTGTFTVFAPTNNAFAAVQDTVNKLLLPEWKNHLADVILYHALSTELLSTELVNGPVETLNGESITINVTSLTINESSNIVTTSGGETFNILASNGVVRKYNIESFSF
jgi:uncharacterized surface protein with fasciclin (FAS1) repeats